MANQRRENRRKLHTAPLQETVQPQDTAIRIETEGRRRSTRRSRREEADLHRFEGKAEKRRVREEKELVLELRREQRRQQAIAQEEMQTPEEREVKVMRKAALRKQKRRMLALRVLIGIAAAALLVTLLYVLLRVRDIRVEGNQWSEAGRVIELSGIQTGDSIFQLNEKEIEEQIEKDPHFIFEDVKYRFPTGITIRVTERQEAACFSFANTYVKVDANGLILGHVEKKEGTDLPVVEGLEVTEYVLGAEIRTTDTYKQDVLRKVSTALCAADQHLQMQTIDVTNVNQVWLRLDEGINICIGQANDLEKKFLWLDEIRETIANEGFSGGTIDLTSTLAPVYIPEVMPEDTDSADS